MNIFKKIGKSIYGPELYQDLKTVSTGSALKYYFKLALILSAVSGIILGFILVANVKTYLTEEAVSGIVSVYPAELNLKIANGEFSTNVKEPYFIPMPENWQAAQATSSDNRIENLAVIDTSVDKFSANILTENKTALFVTKNSILSYEDGSLKVTSFSEQKNLKYELNREGISWMANKVMPMIKPLVYLIPIFVFMGVFSTYAFGLLPLFLLALLVWLVLIAKKQDNGYMQAYRVTLHAVTLVYILQLIISLILSGNISWFWTALITILVVIVNVKKGIVLETPVATPKVETAESQTSPEIK
jgi:hypothetical protein